MKLLSTDFIKISSLFIFIVLINIIGYNFVSYDYENINPYKYLLFYFINVVILSIIINFKSININILGLFFILLLVNLIDNYGDYIFYYFRSEKYLLYIWYFYVLLSVTIIFNFSKKYFKRLEICLSIIIFNIFFMTMIFLDNIFLKSFIYYFLFLTSFFPLTFFINKIIIKLIEIKVHK